MWSESEKEFLKRQAGILSSNEISKILKKKPDCIRQMACTLGVSLYIDKLDSKSKNLMLKMLMNKHPRQKISQVTGISLSTVCAYAKNPNKCNKPKRGNKSSLIFGHTTNNLVNAVFSL
jgi:hypothetical protein